MEWLAVWYLAINLSLSTWWKKKPKKENYFQKNCQKLNPPSAADEAAKWGSHPLAKWRKSWRSSTSHMGLTLLASWGQTPLNNYSHPGMGWDGMGRTCIPNQTIAATLQKISFMKSEFGAD